MASDMDANDGTKDNADDSTTTLQPGRDKQVISKNHLLVKKMGIEHAISVLGPGKSKEQVVAMMETLQQQKSSVNGFARMELRKRMVLKAQDIGMKLNGTFVRRFDDIVESWASDSSNENAKCVWQIIYGDYDDDPTWLERMEKQFMEKVHWKYADDDCKEPRKGCVQILITRIKNDLIKVINKASTATHGKIIRISRDKSEIHHDNKYKKRKKGQWSQSFIYDTRSDSDWDAEVPEIIQDGLSYNELKEQLETRTKQLFVAGRELAATKKSNQKEANKQKQVNENKELRQSITLVTKDYQNKLAAAQRNQDKANIASAARSNKRTKATAVKQKQPYQRREASPEPPHELSEYEKQRAERMKRNQAYLESVGLGESFRTELTTKAKRKRTKSTQKEQAKQTRTSKRSNPPNPRKPYKDVIDSSSSDNDDVSNSNDIDGDEIENVMEDEQVDELKDQDHNSTAEDPTGEYMVEIVGHCIKKGVPMLSMKWDNNYVSWDKMSDVQKDVRKMVKDYLAKHSLGTDLLPVVNHNKTVKMTEGTKTNNSNGELLICRNNHYNYALGITYKEELNFAYWHEGQEMYGIPCADCHNEFVSDGSATELNQNKIKPDNKHPIMTCTNREKVGCRHVVCHTCFFNGMEMMLKNQTVNGISRRSRNNPSNP